MLNLTIFRFYIYKKIKRGVKMDLLLNIKDFLTEAKGAGTYAGAIEIADLEKYAEETFRGDALKDRERWTKKGRGAGLQGREENLGHQQSC